MRAHLVSFSRYWDIVRFKTYANLKRDIDQTYLGAVWWVLEPLLNATVLFVVFHHALRVNSLGFGFLLVGNVIYGHFATSINTGAAAMQNNAGLMQQIQLPKSLYPIIAICNVTWKFFFSLAVIFPILWCLHAPVTWAYLALPLLFLFQFLAVICLSLAISILLPYFPDGKTLLSTFLSAGMLFSGVVFEGEAVAPSWRPLFYLNPVAPVIEGFRAVLLRGQWPDWPHFGGALALCLAACVFGFYLIDRLGGKVTKLPL